MLREWSDNQRRVYIDTLQIYDAYMDAFQKNRSYRGGMHWKKSKGRQYLFRTRDRYGNGKSLGPRTEETEKVLAEFRAAKQKSNERLSELKTRITEQARFCKAAHLQRVPRLVTAILRLLEQQNMLGKNTTVVGTNGMFAYETAAGVFLDPSMMTTQDMDILWDTRSSLKLLCDPETRKQGLIGILKKVDRSFELLNKNSYRAANKNGFMVDLIKAESRRVMDESAETVRIGDEDDLQPVGVPNIQWLLSSPKFSSVVIGDDGYPARMITSDPRSFALHKLWLSKQPGREPVKKQRDRHQALAVARLVMARLPEYPFDPEALRMFPRKLVETGRRQMLDDDLPAGF